MSNITDLTLVELVSKIKKKEISSKEITSAYIERSKKSKKLNTYVTDDFANALKKADNFDNNPNFEKKLPGIPIAVKDLFCTKNLKTTAGSKILSNFIPTYESTVTENLWNEGSILLGKLNCDEFAMGSSNETSFFGNVESPIGKKFSSRWILWWISISSCWAVNSNYYWYRYWWIYKTTSFFYRNSRIKTYLW